MIQYDTENIQKIIILCIISVVSSIWHITNDITNRSGLRQFVNFITSVLLSMSVGYSLFLHYQTGFEFITIIAITMLCGAMLTVVLEKLQTTLPTILVQSIVNFVETITGYWISIIIKSKKYSSDTNNTANDNITDDAGKQNE